MSATRYTIAVNGVILCQRSRKEDAQRVFDAEIAEQPENRVEMTTAKGAILATHIPDTTPVIPDAPQQPAEPVTVPDSAIDVLNALKAELDAIPADLEPETPKPSKSATAAVRRNLMKDWVNTFGQSGITTGEVWEHCSKTNAEDFERDARAYLGDKSELSSATLRAADWPAIYAEFYPMQDAAPVPEGAELIGHVELNPLPTFVPAAADTDAVPLPRRKPTTVYYVWIDNVRGPKIAKKDQALREYDLTVKGNKSAHVELRTGNGRLIQEHKLAAPKPVLPKKPAAKRAARKGTRHLPNVVPANIPIYRPPSGTVRDSVIRFLDQHVGVSYTSTEIMHMLGRTNGVNNICTQMANDGRIAWASQPGETKRFTSLKSLDLPKGTPVSLDALQAAARKIAATHLERARGEGRRVKAGA